MASQDGGSPGSLNGMGRALKLVLPAWPQPWHWRVNAFHIGEVPNVVPHVTAPRWRRGPEGRLLADVGEFRLEAHAGLGRLRTARFTVLRRQYGQGSLFALVGSGTAPSLFAAMRAAEKVAGRFL